MLSVVCEVFANSYNRLVVLLHVILTMVGMDTS